MLSRRSVRVKIMQLLYAKDRDESLDTGQLYTLYDQAIEHCFELFLFSVHLYITIASKAVEDEALRKTKHIPTDFDKSFSAKLFHNDIIQSIANDKKLNAQLKKIGILEYDVEDFTLKMYKEFAKTEEYKNYILNAEKRERDLEILLELFRYLRSHEYYNEVSDEYYANWYDDKSLVVGALKKYLKAQPADEGQYKDYSPSLETSEEFGKLLLKLVIDKESDLEKRIIPFLENWDSERLAVLDMILLKMALAEMDQFDTIPGHVTINEYVEIAKNYSTEKSKEFINGVLDAIYKSEDPTAKS